MGNISFLAKKNTYPKNLVYKAFGAEFVDGIALFQLQAYLSFGM
jgi:hypothetical protein